MEGWSLNDPTLFEKEKELKLGGSRIPEFENFPKAPKGFRYQKIEVTEPL